MLALLQQKMMPNLLLWLLFAPVPLLLFLQPPTPTGRLSIFLPACRAAAASGGAGGVWQTELAGQGLFDTGGLPAAPDAPPLQAVA